MPLTLSTIAICNAPNEALYMMFDGHTQHSPDEMLKMLNDIIDCARANNMKTPYLADLGEKLKHKNRSHH